MELIITMAILAFVLAGASQMIVGLLRQAKQQGKIAESNIEGIIGLEQLRQDVDRAGYGLPWVIPSELTYSEASEVGAMEYNDAPPTSQTTGTNNNPRAILSGNGVGVNESDILVLKAANIAEDDTCKKWTYLQNGNIHKTWGGTEDLISTDNVIVLSPGATDATRRTLVVDRVNTTTWRTTFGNTANFAPVSSDTRFVYGISPDTTTPQMPFNRADYYISSDPALLPGRCAPHTGVLVKSVIKHSNGERDKDVLPLLDCVADMNVVFLLDTDANGVLEPFGDISSGKNAQEIRDYLKEVRIYILAHEGQKDTQYIHSPTTIRVGETSVGFYDDYDIGSNVNYRWKVYTMSVRPHNLK